MKNIEIGTKEKFQMTSLCHFLTAGWHPSSGSDDTPEKSSLNAYSCSPPRYRVSDPDPGFVHLLDPDPGVTLLEQNFDKY